MKCCFSGRETPAEKLFILYYPPAMAHQKWDKSVYASASAGEALRETVDRLRGFFRRYVVGRRPILGPALGVAGLVLFAGWLEMAGSGWEQAGFLRRWGQLFVALILVSFGSFHLRRFLRRVRRWKEGGRETVRAELEEIEKQIARLPDDPTAEEAADMMRRRCPDVLSVLAFDGTYFHAFTYLDFVMFSELKHPARQEELPDKHSLNRDAYYVGDLVYDNWRIFHKDDREVEDPRFVGSGGRRGVI